MNDEEDNEHIDNKLGITNNISTIFSKAHDDSAAADFEIARANIHNIIDNAQEAMHKLAQIADSSQHPRAYEVYAKLMDSVLQANKDLLDLQAKIREIKSADEPVNGAVTKTINNNMFVGSTAELQKMIESMKK